MNERTFVNVELLLVTEKLNTMVATQVKAEIQCLWVSAIGLKGLSKCFYHPSVVNFQKFCGQKGQKQAKSAKVCIWLRTPLPSAEKIHTFYLFLWLP